MRKHGWQLPYHPLQVVAVAVFLALGFAFYVFFAPFVGKKLYQYIVMGVYTPLLVCSFGLYIWCAAADPADPGVFKSKKYLKSAQHQKGTKSKESKLGGESNSSIHDPNVAAKGDKSVDKDLKSVDASIEDFEAESEDKNVSSHCSSCFLGVLFPCMFFCKCRTGEESSGQQMSEDGMFYCSLCEVEVFKYSKHCRVCDKCVDCFDHHCRWLNNCIGKKNYRKFFTLMVFSLLLLILQWSTGILVMVCCFIDRKRFAVDITSKLGSSFSIVPFVIVVAVCTILAMIATLPLAQLFCFHILLVKKGISTYDYIIALRDQEQQVVGGQQSPQMSQVSSLTGLSSASSFNTFHRGAWCTPPRLFLEDQFDVVPPDTGSVSSYGKKTVVEEPVKKKNTAVKISPWTLARLNAEEVSKVAAEARKKSKILQPIPKREGSLGLERDGSFGSSGRRMVQKLDYNRRRNSKRVRIPADLTLEPLPNISAKSAGRHETTLSRDTSTSLAPPHLDVRSAFRNSLAMSSATHMVASSPDSSLDSPDLHPFRVSSSGTEESRRLTGLPVVGTAALAGIPLSRSTSDGYEASGGEDSDRVPSAPAQRPVNWSSLLFGSNREARVSKLKASSSSLGHVDSRRV
ncbi:Probable protein S-acyltransferase 22 [Ancistrocladus abbreviatus]